MGGLAIKRKIIRISRSFVMSDKARGKRKQTETGAKKQKSRGYGNSPGFLCKVYDIISDLSNAKVVSWNADGTALVIKNQGEFADKILSTNFKHSNFTSFVRQLNMYGFHKVAQEDNAICFSHPQFRRGTREFLAAIKRKTAKKESPPEDASIQICLRDSIEKFNLRLSQLEQKDKDCEWLKTECHKLQQRNQQLEMFYKWINNFCSYSEPASVSKPICSTFTEGQVQKNSPELLNNYYNGLQKLFSNTTSNFAVCNGSAESTKILDKFGLHKSRGTANSKMLLCQGAEEQELIELPMPSLCGVFKSPGPSPKLSPLRLEASPNDAAILSPRPMRKHKECPSTDKRAGTKEEINSAISNDLD